MDDTTTTTATTVEDPTTVLIAQLAAKDREIKRLTALLENNSSTKRTTTVTTEEGTSSSTQDGGDSPSGDGTLIRTLPEALARLRREEKRAKAREEELVEACERERARAAALGTDLDTAQGKIEDMKEKLREANRLKVKAQSQSASTKGELDAANETIGRLDKELDTAVRELNEVKLARQELNDVLNQTRISANEQLVAVTERATVAEQERDAHLLKCIELEERAKAASAFEIELKSTRELLEATKHAGRQNAQLVKDLKLELSKHKRSGVSEAQVSERVARELADRLEVLLKENASLKERVAYLQDAIQSLTAELNAIKRGGSVR